MRGRVLTLNADVHAGTDLRRVRVAGVASDEDTVRRVGQSGRNALTDLVGRPP